LRARHVKPLLAVLLASATAWALPPAPEAASLPAPPGRVLPLAPELWRPLRESLDPVLERRLRESLDARPGLGNLVRDGRLAVALVDLADPARPHLAGVNGDRMIYAASLPKIAVLLAACEALEAGRLRESAAVLHDMEAMIRRSDNAAATRMIDRVGLRRIDDVLMQDRYRLFDPEQGGGLWVGRAYARNSRRIPDPVAGLSHGATALQVARFYYLLAHGRLVNRERSRQMLDVLSDPGISHKFVRSLVEADARLGHVYRKSGTWRNWHADSALVWEEGWRRYILVGLVESPEGEQILRSLVPLAEGLLRPAGAGMVAASP
jgi:beta-lactamase class A